ncbi:YpsA SLOG family protein, partial [Magnetococcales bacterium HHB-1]
MSIGKLISGGQTGVDRAALDFAKNFDIQCGGWCPKGRKAEDGQIDLKYPLREMRSAAYPNRTRKNVADSDATLILQRSSYSRGTALTLRYA